MSEIQFEQSNKLTNLKVTQNELQTALPVNNLTVNSSLLEGQSVNVSHNLSNKKTQGFYVLVIDGDNQGFDSVTRYITLDLVDQVSINATSSVTSYPLITGDVMSDHKYDEPKTINISGTFSLAGKFNKSFTNGGIGEERLKNIQEYFEAVMKYGKTMSLMFLNYNDANTNGEAVFKQRDNLIFTSIGWTPKLNSLKFNFGLKEVYFFESSSEVEVSEYEGDPDLPTIVEAQTIDFVQDILGEENATAEIIKVLQDNGLINRNFWEAVGEYFIGAGVAALGAIVLGLAVNYGIISASVALGAVFPVGTIIVGAAAIAIGIAVMIGSVIKGIKKRTLIHEFRAYDNDVDMQKESERFVNTINAAKDAMDSVISDNNIKIYGINYTSLKKPCEMYLTIDSNMYLFHFEYQNVKKRWSVNVTQIGNTEEAVTLSGGNNTIDLVGKAGMFDLQQNDAIFKTSRYVRVYFINTGLVYLESENQAALESALKNMWENKECGFLGYTEDEMVGDAPLNDLITKYKTDGVYTNLNNFKLIVSGSDIEQLKERCEDAIYNSLKQNA